MAKVKVLDESDNDSGLETEALVRSVKDDLENAVSQGKSLSSEVMVIAPISKTPGVWPISWQVISSSPSKRPKVSLAELDPVARIRRVHAMLARELELLGLKHEIASQARGEIDRGQREYFLRHQLRAIQEELGEADEIGEEVGRYRAAAEKKGLSNEAAVELERQLRRLERSQPDSAEGSVIRTYLDWLTGLPWSSKSDDNLDLGNAREVLDEDHFGLERVKERIIEYLAVRKLNPSVKGPILCFVGPPGVGKTSLGRSVARALGRKFVRLSLGGVRDEAEIRGHRRTYVGALPGRILQGIHQAETSNPVFMLDEIDKLGSDLPRRPVSGAARGPSTPSRTAVSAITSWASSTTFPGSCSSPPPISSIPSCRLFSIAWRSSGSPATPATRSWRSHGDTSSRSRSPKTVCAKSRSASRRRLSTRSSRTMPKKPVCAISSARSPRCVAR